MKVIYIFILTLIFSSSLFASYNEYKTDLYFINGVWNDKFDARKNLNKLEKILPVKLKDGFNGFYLSHNWSMGVMTDLLETFYQLKQNGQISDIGFYYALYVALGTVSVTDSLYLLSGKLFGDIIALEDTIEANILEMLNKYNSKSYNKGHRVLLVAHSQGNIYANAVYERLSWKKNYTKIVAIGSPANNVAGNGEHITLTSDGVIKYVVGSMNGNVAGSGHTFVDAYLANEASKNAILLAVENGKNSLKTTSSQWDILNNNKNVTDCNERLVDITHKHFAYGDKHGVYPFNENGKRYDLGSTIVMASDGGTSKLNSWTDKDEKTECYKLSGTDEIIEKKAIDEECPSGGVLFQLASWEILRKYGSTNNTPFCRAYHSQQVCAIVVNRSCYCCGSTFISFPYQEAKPQISSFSIQKSEVLKGVVNIDSNETCTKESNIL